MIAIAASSDDHEPTVFHDYIGRPVLPLCAEPAIPDLTPTEDGLGVQYVATEHRPLCRHLTPTAQQTVDSDNDGRDDVLVIVRQHHDDLDGDGVVDAGERVVMYWDTFRVLRPRTVAPIGDMAGVFVQACCKLVKRS